MPLCSEEDDVGDRQAHALVCRDKQADPRIPIPDETSSTGTSRSLATTEKLTYRTVSSAQSSRFPAKRQLPVAVQACELRTADPAVETPNALARPRMHDCLITTTTKAMRTTEER